MNDKQKKLILGALCAVILIALFALLLGHSGNEGLPSEEQTPLVTGVEIITKDDEPEVTPEDTESPVPTEGTESAETGDEPSEAAAPTEEAAFKVSYHFRSSKLLDDHYTKHGIEMGFASAEEYEAAASAVVNDPAALHKTEAEDGDDVYYLEESNEFVIVSVDGYIRTYFLPSAGKAYYDRQ